MNGPNFRSVKESNVKLGPKGKNQKEKSARKESCDKRLAKKGKGSGIDSFFVKSDSKKKVVKDEKEIVRMKNKELLEKFIKEPEEEVSISWENKSELESIRGGYVNYKEIEDILRTLEVEGTGAGVMIWEGFFNSVRKLIKEVQDLKIKVVELSKSVSQEEVKSQKEDKIMVEKIEIEKDEKSLRREERIKEYKEAGTWLEESQWKLLNDGQKALKRFRFSDKHQNMDPTQFRQLNMEEKENFILSKLQWRNQRRKELINLLEEEGKKQEAEKSLKNLDFFNGRYFDFYLKRWRSIGDKNLEEYGYFKRRRRSRYRKKNGNPYYL